MKYSEVNVQSVTHRGSLFRDNIHGVIGQDGAYSVELPDGRVFWTFGDTLLGPGRNDYDPGRTSMDKWLSLDPWARENVRMLSNCGGITTEDILTLLPSVQYVAGNGAGPGPGEIIAPPDELRHSGGRYRPFWPMDGTVSAGNLYLFYLMVDCGTAANDMGPDINVYGTGIAVAEPPYGRFTRLVPDIPAPPQQDPANAGQASFVFWNNGRKPDGTQISDYGIAILEQPEYLYVYGSRVVIRGRSVSHEVTVARVRSTDIGSLSRYEYLCSPRGAGETWCSDPCRATAVFDGNANELSVTYNPYQKLFCAVYSYAGEGPGSGRDIHMRISESPAGPWSEPAVLYSMRGSTPFDYCYAAKEHPEFRRENGKTTYITAVSHQRYFPELIEVEFF